MGAPNDAQPTSPSTAPVTTAPATAAPATAAPATAAQTQAAQTQAAATRSQASVHNRRDLLRGALAVGALAGLAGKQAEARPVVEPRLMRRPRPTIERGAVERSSPPLPFISIIALNRMAYGPASGDTGAFSALGSTASERMSAYVAQQLDPSSIPDTDLENRLASAGFASVGLSSNPNNYLATLWDWYINDNAPGGNTSSSIPRDELIRATFMRAMYSKRQLEQVMVRFWLNHFNVYIEHSSFVRATFPHLELVVRQNAFGNFRTLLEAVAKSPAMLYYLDNYTSSDAGPNENFCRELFELHTLGSENYQGTKLQSQVPLDGEGLPIGYVDADVFEATRCFTGWSFSYGVDGDGDTGLFHYRPAWHDRFQKNVLGKFIPQDQSDMKDARDVLDTLAAHPGTGRHIAGKLCRRFISDNPPQSIIDAAAELFTAQWQAPDQLKQVMELILLSPEFSSTWGEKIKQPFEVAVSALRAASANFTLKMNDSDTNSFLYRFSETGEEPFHWPAPNGFPDSRGAWMRMKPRLMSWRLCGWLVDFEKSSGIYYLNILGQTPASVRSANELADFWIGRILKRPMSAEDREEIVQFMAQGFNPDLDLNLNDEDTADRLRSMVGLILMSPDFLWR